MRPEHKQLVVKALILTFIGLITLIIALPLYWLVITSFKPQAEWWVRPPTWIPSKIYYENFLYMWNVGGDKAFVNTVIIGFSSAILCTILGVFTGYSISRFKTGGNNLLFFIISLRMLPPAVIIVPLILMYTFFGLIDTHLGLILFYTLMNLPYTVYLSKSFFDTIDISIEEAAMIDGCSYSEILFRFVLPLSAPGVVTCFLISLIFAWNELFFAIIMTKSNAFTIPVKLVAWESGTTGNYWGPQSAQALVAILPVLVITYITQKWMIRGLTLGAVKRV